ncbi:hypothetical protein CoNPh26_CDS0064 [Staphylococcus phage S-CoN_Ph26]|nr:hypothetical protein CoNPh26_CDS0064 [Staphylococcus phage S-CoN_Ph26]
MIIFLITTSQTIKRTTNNLIAMEYIVLYKITLLVTMALFNVEGRKRFRKTQFKLKKFCLSNIDNKSININELLL